MSEMDKNDHREIGKALDLFHMQEEAIGSIFWHPDGWSIFRKIESYIRDVIEEKGYQEVKTPQLIDRRLWEQSGHWAKFRNNMFTVAEQEDDDSNDDRILAIKPMNCPGHVQIFKQGVVSYRELPIRYAEFGSCHRNEPSGGLHGIMRVRSFTQDDAHIFCTKEQITKEVSDFVKLLGDVYTKFGFNDFILKLSTRPDVRSGSDEDWDYAENALKAAVEGLGMDYELQPKEGAFYGPKLEFTLVDIHGRHWQCGTLQLDMVLPVNLDATYVDSDGARKHPIMLHRAILGSLERFLGILLEHYGGELPFWLCPTQVGVVPISEHHREYAAKVVSDLKAIGVKAKVNDEPMHFNKRIRSFLEKRVPTVFVVGDAEVNSNAVNIRNRGSKEMEMVPLEDAKNRFKDLL